MVKLYLNPKKALEESRRQWDADTKPPDTPNALMEVPGQQGRLMLLPDRVRILRTSFMGAATEEILISKITAIKFKEAKFGNGHIDFDFAGGGETSFIFQHKHEKEMEAMKAAIEQKMDEARRPTVQQTQQPSAYDELAKLAALRDQGIVTEEEFQEQKKKLLGTQNATQSQKRFDPQTGRQL